MSDNPPADWYPDPEVPGQQRYWDGSQWTEHRAPGAAPTPASAAPADMSSQPSWQSSAPAEGQAWGGGAATPTGQPPQTWLWQSIVATLLCCLPFGVAGIVFASQANSAVSTGNYALAEEKAKQAKTWTLVSVGVGVLGIIAYLVFIGFAIAGDANFS